MATIETIVHFFYTDAIDLTHENAVIILNIASSYEMDMLVDKCHQFYMKKLSIDNAVSTLKIADEHCLADLRKQALDLICDNFSEVPAIQCQQLSYSLLRELLKNGNFGNLHVTRLLEWFQYDEDGRCEHMPELIKLIQWDQLTQQVSFAFKLVDRVLFVLFMDDSSWTTHSRRCATDSARQV